VGRSFQSPCFKRGDCLSAAYHRRPFDLRRSTDSGGATVTVSRDGTRTLWRPPEVLGPWRFSGGLVRPWPLADEPRDSGCAVLSRFLQGGHLDA
jgi:hypothetical protein